MLAKTAVTVAALASSAAAFMPNLAARQTTNVPTTSVPTTNTAATNTAATNTGVSGTDVPTECLSAAALLTEVPLPPSELLTALAAIPTTVTGACDVVTLIPSELRSEYSSWTSEVLVWYSENMAQITSFASQCTVLVGPLSTLSSLAATSCPGSPAGNSSTTSGATDTPNSNSPSTATGTATGSATGAGSATASPKPAGAARFEVGFLAAAVLGLAGALVAL